jgi:RNA polymerase sigma factor (sigma-70 family)
MFRAGRYNYCCAIKDPALFQPRILGDIKNHGLGVGGLDDRTRQLNLVQLIGQFLGGQEELLCAIHHELLSVTREVSAKVIRRCSLPRDLTEDMTQDAFLKLRACLRHYEPDRARGNPEGWWRVVLYRHLLDLYHERHHTKSLTEEPTILPTQYDLDRVEQLERDHELKQQMLQEIQSWRQDKDRMHASIIFQLRVLPVNILQRAKQEEVAAQLNRSQFFVSRWESWLRNRLKQLTPRNDSDGNRRMAPTPNR